MAASRPKGLLWATTAGTDLVNEIRRTDNPEPNRTQVREEAKARIRTLAAKVTSGARPGAEATGGACLGSRVRPSLEPTRGLRNHQLQTHLVTPALAKFPPMTS
jgi:hypothetical protein